jgi:hypothetical protein
MRNQVLIFQGAYRNLLSLYLPIFYNEAYVIFDPLGNVYITIEIAVQTRSNQRGWESVGLHFEHLIEALVAGCILHQFMNLLLEGKT